jgi:hypothetical protein
MTSDRHLRKSAFLHSMPATRGSAPSDATPIELSHQDA